MNELARRIDAQMRARGLSDFDAAPLLDVRHTTVNRWRRGVVIPPAKRAGVLAEFLGVPRSQVLEWMADAERVEPERWANRSDTDAELAALHREIDDLRREVVRLRDEQQRQQDKRRNPADSRAEPLPRREAQQSPQPQRPAPQNG